MRLKMVRKFHQPAARSEHNICHCLYKKVDDKSRRRNAAAKFWIDRSADAALRLLVNGKRGEPFRPTTSVLPRVVAAPTVPYIL